MTLQDSDIEEAMSANELIRGLLDASAITSIPVLLVHEEYRQDPESAIESGAFSYVKPGAIEPTVVNGVSTIVLFADRDVFGSVEQEEDSDD